MRPMPNNATIPTIEGLTPLILWYTLAGLVGIGALIILGDKVLEVFKKHREDEKAKEDGTIQGQLDKINKRLDTIDDYIRESDKKFDRDNRRLNSLEANVAHIERGINALARAELAHLQHDITGNHTDNLGQAEREITNYLTKKEADT